MMNKRRGYEFEAELCEGLRLAGLVHYKIPDARTMQHLMTFKVPADVLYTVDGKLVTLEAKQTKLASLPWANIKEHQLDWVMRNPASAFFVVNFNNRQFGAKKVNETYIVTAANIMKWRTIYANSIPREVFKAECQELQRLTASHNPDGDRAFIRYENKWH